MNKQVTIEPPLDVAVLGSGKMARDIGFLCLEQGCRVTWVTGVGSVSELHAFVHNKVDRVASMMGIEVEPNLYRVIALESDESLSVTAVIETTKEDVGAKREKIRAVRPRIPLEALIFSNSSSILPNEIGPDVIGMHFFYPSTLTRFVEVVFPPDIDDDRRRRALLMTEALGVKSVCQDNESAFVANRLLLPLEAETVRLFLGGYDKEMLDAASASPFISIGQFSMADEIGVDVLEAGVSRYVSRMEASRQSDYAGLSAVLSHWRGKGILGKKNKRTLKKTPDDELRSAGINVRAGVNPAPTDLYGHFLDLFFNTCLMFVERAECDLSALSLILSSAFGAETSLEEAVSQIDRRRLHTSLQTLHQETGLWYFRPSRLLDRSPDVPCRRV